MKRTFVLVCVLLPCALVPAVAQLPTLPFVVLPLVDDSAETCTGSPIGAVVQVRLGPQAISLILIVTGNPDETRQLYWVRSDGGACHAGCNFTNVGSVTTNSSGFGFAYLEFRDAYARYPTHWDLSPDLVQSGCDPVALGANANYYSGPFEPGAVKQAGDSVP